MRYKDGLLTPVGIKLKELEERIEKLENKKEVDPIMLFGMLKGYEERIEKLETQLNPIEGTIRVKGYEPTKTIELTEIELEYLRKLLRDRKNHLNKLNGK